MDQPDRRRGADRLFGVVRDGRHAEAHCLQHALVVRREQCHARPDEIADRTGTVREDELGPPSRPIVIRQRPEVERTERTDECLVERSQFSGRGDRAMGGDDAYAEHVTPLDEEQQPLQCGSVEQVDVVDHDSRRFAAHLGEQ